LNTSTRIAPRRLVTRTVRRLAGALATIVGVTAFAWSLSSCGGAAAKAIEPEAPNAKTALEGDSGKCTTVADLGAPLIVDWSPTLRGDLEVAMKQGVVVAHYDCNTLRILPSCNVEGSYGFMGVTKKEEIVQILNADDAKVNLPLSGAKIGAELKDGSALNIALIIIGQKVTTHTEVTTSKLKGDDCKGATHYLRAATVGAFAMKTSTSADVKTSAEIFGAGGDTGSTTSKKFDSKDGDMSACATAKTDSVAPPDQCGAVLRLTLAAISTKGPTTTLVDGEATDRGASKNDVGCPTGFVYSKGKCTQPEKEASHRCNPDDKQECTEQCDLGNAVSCRLLGTFFEFGKGNAAVDKKKAVDLYTKACDGGDPVGCSSAGFLYDVPNPPVPVDIAKAISFDQKACDAGDPRGCSNLGVKYGTGTGVPIDRGKAISLYEKACGGGFAMGCNNLAVMYTNGPAAYQGPDAPKALDLWKRACEGNVARACASLGYMIIKGYGGATVDLVRAVGLFGKACDGGWNLGCGYLGVAYDKGLAVPVDGAKAFPLMQKGCPSGVPVACARLGVHYADGTNVAADPKMAVSYFQKGCSGGDPDGEGCGRLASAYEDGDGGLTVDLAKATELHQKACTLGFQPSCDRMKSMKPGQKVLTPLKKDPKKDPKAATSSSAIAPVSSAKPPTGAPSASAKPPGPKPTK
jgi:TPR repeat protein